MKRRILVVSMVALATLSIGAPVDAAGPDRPVRPCAGNSGLVWENESDDGSTANLFSMGCDGVIHQITRADPGQGGSELPRWGRHRTVYFDSDRAGGVHLFRMATTSGPRAEQLTVTDGLEFSPAPTPDGRQVVFEHATADGSDDGLFVMADRPRTAETAFRQLTSNPNSKHGGFDTNPDVSPDGHTVAFIRVLDPTFGSALSAVFTIRLDGTNLRQLTPFDLNAITPRWSHNGRRLLFSSHGDSFSNTVSANIYIVDADGQHLRNLTNEPPGSHAFTPTWAPNGDRFVYTHSAPGLPATQLLLRRLDRPSTTVLFQGNSGTDFNADWR